jgi:hypothetical protein
VITLHTSARGFPLAWLSPPIDRPVLTVELYCKWYTLWLVSPAGAIDSVPFYHLSDLSTAGPALTPYIDHVPNPAVVLRLCEARGYHLDDIAYELIVGRWEIEGRENPDYIGK